MTYFNFDARARARNKSHRPKAYKEMIDGKKASSYGGRKNAIDSVHKNDRVFLYHTGIGICAIGRVTSEYVKERENGHERYVEITYTKTIDPEKEPDRALSARELNSELGTKWSFRQTRFSISDEEADILEKMFKEKP